MRKTINALAMAALLGVAPMALGACHADDNDAVGQAKELSDSVRRQNAIVNLTRIYTSALSKNNGDRNSAEVKTLADQIVQPLVQAYADNPADNAARKAIIDLLKETRDARAIPAFTKALDWRMEVSEEQAIASAESLQQMTLTDAQKSEVATAIGGALEKVQGARQVDQRMRVEFLRALGGLHHASATAVLMRIATTRSEAQPFLINRLAYEQLAQAPTPDAIPAFIQALMFCDTKRPDMRVNDLASLGLVNIGKSAVPALLDVVAGKNAAAIASANEYLAIGRAIDATKAAMLDPQSEVIAQALAVLGDIGDRSALPAILAIANPPGADKQKGAPPPGEAQKRIAAGVALIRMHREASDGEAIRTALKAVFKSGDKPTRAQLSAGFARFYDPAMLPFLLENATKEEDEVPEIRTLSFTAFSLLANAAEAIQARTLIAKEPGAEDGGFKTNFMENDVALQTAAECNEDVACYVKKLGDSNRAAVRKATFMLARYGHGNQAALDALIGKLNHPAKEVREDVLYAIDFLADQGSPAAIAKIQELKKAEEGRSSWEQLKVLALTTAGRLRLRGTN